MKIENAIEVNNVSMCFNLSKQKVDNIKEYVIRALKRQLFYEEFWALQDISFEVRKGDSVGLVGMNRLRKEHHAENHRGGLKAHEGKRGDYGDHRSHD